MIVAKRFSLVGRGLGYLAPPLAALAAGGFFVYVMLIGAIQKPTSKHLVLAAVIALPHLLSVVGAPGYLYAVFARPERRPGQKQALFVSLCVAAVSSFLGTLLSLLVLLLPVALPALITLVLCIRLIGRWRPSFFGLAPRRNEIAHP